MQQCFDVSVRKGETLQSANVVGMARNVVRHDHVFVIDFVKRASNRKHVHLSLVEIDLLKIASFPAYVAKMNVENFLSLAQVTDDVVDFAIRF